MKHQGLTFIELILVVAIVLILAGLSGGLYSRYVVDVEGANVQKQLMSSLQKARDYSMVSKKSGLSGWGVKIESDKIVLYQGSSYVSRNPELDEIFSHSTETEIVGPTEINFLRVTGLPSTSGNFTITARANTYTVSVNLEGRVGQ